MKKPFLALAITILLSALSITAQTFEVKYNLSDFTITRGADSLVSVTSKHRSFFAGDLQSPQLPFLPANILCAQGVTECNPVFSYEKEPIATGVLLNTIPPVYPTSIDPSTIDYTPQIARTSQSKPYNYEGVGQMMGYSFARIALSPFEYDYDTRTLYFIKSFVITLNERVSQQKVSTKNGVKSAPLGDPQFVSKLVLNSQEISSMYPSIPQKQIKNIFRSGIYEREDSASYGDAPGMETAEAELYTVDYLIVTTTKLKSAFEKLAQWKRVRGLNPEIITVDNLSPLQIKQKIFQYYQQFGSIWVLLAGDEKMIPVHECKDYYGKDAACDLYYACFDYNFEWNDYEDLDLIPDVHLSRLSVRSPEQAEAIVYKTISYEQHESSENTSVNILFYAVLTDPCLYPFYYYSEQLISMLQEECVPLDYDTHFVANSPTYLGPYFLNNYGIINIDSHGSDKAFLINNVVKESNDPIFDVTDVGKLTNEIPFIVTTNACFTNKFNSNIEPCLSEALMRKDEGGAIAYFGPSSNGLVPDAGAGVVGSHLYSAYFIRSILKENLSIGEALSVAKILCINEYMWNDVIKKMYDHLQKTTNLLGDPELHYYTEILPMIEPIVHKVTCDSVIITLPAGEYNNAIVSLYDPNRTNGYFARKEAREGETISFPISNFKSFTNPPMLQLVVSKDGHVPFIQELYLCKIQGNTVLNTNLFGKFSIGSIPGIYSIKWNISDSKSNGLETGLSTQRNYFSLANADEPSCNVYFNKVVPQEIYGIEKTTLSAEFYFTDIFNGVDYIQPIEGIDVVYLGNFKGSFSQESSGYYPGISSTTISGEFDEYLKG
ncbi:MAG: hypothetical protein K2J74_06825, partial [Muribaculaceae bacterium]|nr:hypothetical protein [Muribaculaceae bacterium]